MSAEPLAGRVVALAGDGGALHRALALACAEAGAKLALGTAEKTHEFPVHSIANEVWALGREHFVSVIDAAAGTDVASFADETWDRLGRCDAFVCCVDLPSRAPLDELSPDEWEAVLQANLTAPFLAGHAFGRLMERQRHGDLVFFAPDRPEEDAAVAAARAGLRAAAERMAHDWGPSGVRVHLITVVEPAEAAAGLLHLLAPGS